MLLLLCHQELQEEGGEEGEEDRDFRTCLYRGKEMGGVGVHRRAPEGGPGGPVQEKELLSRNDGSHYIDGPSQILLKGRVPKIEGKLELHAVYEGIAANENPFQELDT